jgi:hypothetical protein
VIARWIRAESSAGEDDGYTSERAHETNEEEREREGDKGRERSGRESSERKKEE